MSSSPATHPQRSPHRDANASANGSLADAMGDKAAHARSLAQRSLDCVVPPSSRRRAYDAASDLASSRPILFSFLVSQLLFCFLPLLLFAAFATSTVAFALGAAIVFALFWIALALLVLVPALLVAASIAFLCWAWALGSFLLARWLYAHAPVGVTGGLKVQAAGKEVHLVKDENGLDGSFNGSK